MYWNITAYGPIDPKHVDTDGATGVLTVVQHALEEEFGTSATDFEVYTVDCGPTATSPGAVLIEATFTSSEDQRSLIDALGSFTVDLEPDGSEEFQFMQMAVYRD